MLRYLQPTLLVALLPLVSSGHIGYSIPDLGNLPLRTTLLTRSTLSSSNTSPQTTLSTVSTDSSTVLITVTDCPYAIPRPAESTTIVTTTSAVATTTYPVSTPAREPQASSSSLARTGNLTISSYVPSHPVSTRTSSTPASVHPSLRLPPWYFLTKNGFHVLKTAASPTETANSAATAAATACPIWYVCRGGRRCFDFATNMTASGTITPTAAAGPSTNGTLQMPLFSKPFCKKCRSRTLTTSTTSRVATKLTASTSTALGGEIHRRPAATNSLVRELNLNFTDASSGTASPKAGLPCRFVHGRPRCGFPLSISKLAQTATAVMDASSSVPASRTYPHATAIASLLVVRKSTSMDGSSETETSQARPSWGGSFRSRAIIT